MELYLVRHGIAGDAVGYGAKQDELRPLTAEGCDKTRGVARGLAELDCRPGRIVSSPLLRAVQTAEILSSELAAGRKVEIQPCLEPGGSFARFVEWLGGCGETSVVAVGHMPDMAEFAERFLTGQVCFDMDFKKAAVCALSFDGRPAPGMARLEWFMPPAALRMIGR